MTESTGFPEPDTDTPLPGMPPAPEPAAAEDSALPSEPVMDLLEAAWGIIANAGAGDWDSQPQAWREAAERWRDRYHAAVRAFCGQLPAEEPDPPLPDGIFGRLELPGFRHYTGWITDEMRYGQQMAVVRDWDGHVITVASVGPNSQVVHLPTPLKRPEPQRALSAGAAGAAVDDGYDEDPWSERNPF